MKIKGWVVQLTMAKSNMVGPWERHHKLTGILYQSEAECIYQYRNGFCLLIKKFWPVAISEIVPTAGQTRGYNDLRGHQCSFLPKHCQRRCTSKQSDWHPLTQDTT
jgi:hypothetical protein